MTVVPEADGVFQGGGIKGLAIAGALLEFASNSHVSVGKWRSVAGTSAGAIIAAYLAAGKPATALADLLNNAPFASFEDFGPGGKFVGGAVNLARHHGLARGEVFRKWFDGQLGQMTFKDVRGDPGDEHPWRLRMVATDVTNHRMCVFPDDLPLYSLPSGGGAIDPDGFKVADAVRMSLSIPFFFQPVELVFRATGQTATIVDGGILSNFPVWLYDTDQHDPTRPTFGLRLTGGKAVGSGLQSFVRMLGWPAALVADIEQTQSSAWDQRFVTVTTRVRTCLVPAGDVGTTDFDLSAPAKQALVDGGKAAAKTFLDAFDLADYRNSFGRPIAAARSNSSGL